MNYILYALATNQGVGGSNPSGRAIFSVLNQLILYNRVKKIQFDNEIKEFVDIGYKVALLFGFLILAIYFYSIHFYPALSASAFFSLLLIAALLGISLSAIFIFPVAYAPWMWSSIFKKRDLTEFIVGCEDAAFVIQAFNEGRLDFNEKIRMRIFYYYNACMLISALFSIVLIEFKYIKCLFFYIVIGIVAATWMFISNEKATDYPHNNIIKNALLPLKLLGHSFYSSICLVVAFYGYKILIPANSTLIQYISIYLFIIIGSSLCFSPPNKDWRFISWAIAMGAAVALMLIIIFQTFSALSTTIVKKFSLGGIEHINIYVANEVCDIFKYNKKLVSCNVQDKNHLVKDVNLLWRIGECYIQFTNAENKLESIIIPAKYVYPSNNYNEN